MPHIASAPAIPSRPRDWFATESGQRLMRAEQREVTPFLTSVYGQSGLYVCGSPSAPPELSGNMLQRVLRLCVDGSHLSGAVRCAQTQLPFVPDSFSLICLMHALERVDQPRQLVMDMAERLLPEGCMLIVVLNPLGLWRTKWSGHALRVPSPARIIRWLDAAGLEVTRRRALGPILSLPPRSGAPPRTTPEPAAAAALPLRAGVLIIARNRRPGMTPLPLSRARMARPGGASVA